MTTRTKKSWIALTAILTFALSLFAGASSAQAHSDEFQSTPENGSTVSQVNSITYIFAEPVEQAFPVEVALQNDAGKIFELGTPTFNSTGETMTVPISAGDLPNGNFTASYRATSADGHPFSGTVVFTVVTGASPAQSVNPSMGASASTSTGADQLHSPMPISFQGDEEANEFPIATLLITVASVLGLALIITAVIVVVRRRKN